jgi:hypothetical protein
MNTKTYKPIVVLCSLSAIGLSTPARADVQLNIGFAFTALNSGDVFAGNLVIDTVTDKISGITNDFTTPPPDPNFTFSNLNGGNPLFNVGDSVTVTPMLVTDATTSQVISDTNTGVTFNWASVTTNSFTCGACDGGVFYNVAYNGPETVNQLLIGGVVKDSFEPGSSVIEFTTGTNGGSGPPPPTVPEPATLWSLLGMGSTIVAISRSRMKSV